MSNARPPHRAGSAALRRAVALTLVPVVLDGCVTTAMWQKLDDTRGERIAAVALTPVTIAIDAALIAGYVCVTADCNGCGHGCGGHCR